jgi:poly(hydroxyalkanoate) granule-associated protein
MTETKKTRKSEARSKSIVDRFEGTIVERPITIANKTFLAGLGLASKVQSDFDAKFEELAKDGEKVRREVRGSFDSLSERVQKEVEAKRKEVTKRAESAVKTVLEYLPVATTNDLSKLDRKLDKVLAEVARSPISAP